MAYFYYFSFGENLNFPDHSLPWIHRPSLILVQIWDLWPVSLLQLLHHKHAYSGLCGSLHWSCHEVAQALFCPFGRGQLSLPSLCSNWLQLLPTEQTFPLGWHQLLPTEQTFPGHQKCWLDCNDLKERKFTTLKTLAILMQGSLSSRTMSTAKNIASIEELKDLNNHKMK